jgi:hypothetical protein
MKLQLALVLALALIGGVWGWRAVRRRWRSLYDEKPVGMSDATYHRRQYRRHLYRRLATAALYAAIGAAIGWALSLYFHLS